MGKAATSLSDEVLARKLSYDWLAANVVASAEAALMKSPIGSFDESSIFSMLTSS